MSNNPLNFVYSTVQIATMLNIGRSTVNKYARSLEEAGYVFRKDEKDHRAFVNHDVVAFRGLLDLLSRGVEYGSAVNSIVEQYYVPENSEESLAVVATPSRSEVATLNAKVDQLIQAVATLASQVEQIVDDRVKSEVAAATASLGDQVNQVVQEVRLAQQQTDRKLDEVISRVETHGKRKKFLGIF
ncbi:hypothetical protein [Paenibacillus sp. Y412MC10]|uniref:hypothetical protein n=1 Tax=Geobacillus sp. (strain Y412MC10) TaxID=481743 RepID=UPI0011AB856D|nr:hypothetical protein [Paenibacillus sp. Y412MC10]